MATELTNADLEILCSWNGTGEQEKEIQNSSGYELVIADRDEYQFGRNINSLAQKANGEFLLIINDDIKLDPNSIDSAIRYLQNDEGVGVVGGPLRGNDGILNHAGILFDSRNTPYHQLEGMLNADSSHLLRKDIILPALSGAMLLIRRKDFLKIKFNEKYKVCGEDIELCLRIREELRLKVCLCKDFSAIHEPSTTRKEKNAFGNASEDIALMRATRRRFLDNASIEELLVEIKASSFESDHLLEIIKNESNIHLQKELINEINHLREQTNVLHLTRIRQEQEIDELKKLLEKKSKKN